MRTRRAQKPAGPQKKKLTKEPSQRKIHLLEKKEQVSQGKNVGDVKKVLCAAMTHRKTAKAKKDPGQKKAIEPQNHTHEQIMYERISNRMRHTTAHF